MTMTPVNTLNKMTNTFWFPHNFLNHWNKTTICLSLSVNSVLPFNSIPMRWRHTENKVFSETTCFPLSPVTETVASTTAAASGCSLYFTLFKQCKEIFPNNRRQVYNFCLLPVNCKNYNQQHRADYNKVGVMGSSLLVRLNASVPSAVVLYTFSLGGLESSQISYVNEIFYCQRIQLRSTLKCI